MKPPAAALAYVAMSRGRHTNTAYLYQRATEHEHPGQSLATDDRTARGTARHAGRLLRAILAADEQPTTGHDLAASAAPAVLPARVRGAIDDRATALHRHTLAHSRWHTAAMLHNTATHARTRDIGLDRSLDDGLEL